MGKIFDYEILKLSEEFYDDYPNPPYVEILKKHVRGYACLLFQSHNGYFICVPYRSEISHKYAFHFKNTRRSQKHKSGLDYTKTVIIKDLKYLSIEKAVIDQDEFVETRKHISYIAEKAEEYVEGYKNHINGTKVLIDKEFHRRYKCSALPYFHSELGMI